MASVLFEPFRRHGHNRIASAVFLCLGVGNRHEEKALVGEDAEHTSMELSS